MTDIIPSGQIDKNWWDILKYVAERSAEKDPVGTFHALLWAMIILTLGPVVIWRYFRYLELKLKHRAEFDKIRRTNPKKQNGKSATKEEDK